MPARQRGAYATFAREIAGPGQAQGKRYVRRRPGGRRGRGLDYRFAGYGRAGREVAEAEQLMIAACGQVRDPQAAIAGPGGEWEPGRLAQDRL